MASVSCVPPARPKPTDRGAISNLHHVSRSGTASFPNYHRYSNCTQNLLVLRATVIGVVWAAV
jgi:hypothetical protein